MSPAAASGLCGLTREQAFAVRAPGSVVVTAGAGTGKTRMLSERFLFHLAEQGLSPLQVVAVTFTEAAAAELRSRIREVIAVRQCATVRAASLPRSAGAAAARGAEWLDLIEAAPIGTFHALAARICREHPEAAGVPMEFTILEETEADLWLAEHLDRVMDSLPDRVYDQLPYSLARPALEALLHDPIAAEKAFARVPEEWVPCARQASERALTQLLATPAWKDAADLVLACQGPPGDLMEENRFLAERALNELSTRPRDCLQRIAAIQLRGGAPTRWRDGELEQVKEKLGVLRKLAKSAVGAGIIGLSPGAGDDLLRSALPCLREAFQLAREQLAAAKWRARVLDFADLEERALRALKDAGVCAYYRQRWRAFLVDEFQDTNPVQSEMLERLAAGAILTLVGDEKQSIYGFRRADATLFAFWRERLCGEGAEPVQLIRTFRTHSALARTLNAICRSLLAELHQELEAEREGMPHPGPHLRVGVVRAGQDVNKGPRQLVEAQRIAGLLQEMLDAGVTVHDPETDSLRPIRPGDIAILSRAWEPLDVYGDALAAVAVPFVHRGGGSLLATREACDGLALLRFLADTGDDLALAAVFRSPFFAVSDHALFNLGRATQERGRLWETACAPLRPDLARPCAVLSELLASRSAEPPAELLRLADRLTGYTAVLANLAGAERREADWRGFVELVRELEQGHPTGAGDVFVVARKLRRLIAAEVEVPRPPLEAGNAVTLTSIHGAKGLEWPVVVVPDLSRVSPPRSPPVLFDPDLGVALQFLDEASQVVRPGLWQLLEWRRRQREEAEERRLLYVAMTRARDHLLLTACGDGAGIWKVLEPSLAETGIPVGAIEFDPEAARPESPPEPPLPPLPELFLTCPVGPAFAELPATGLSEYARCPRRFHFRFVEGHPGLGEGAAQARRVGSLTHIALQHGLRDPASLARFDPLLPPALVEEALELAGQFDRDPAFSEYRIASGEREKPVNYHFEGLNLYGVIDLLGRDFVLDYKTDQEIAPDHHRFQLWAYAAATGQPQAVIAYLRHGLVRRFDRVALERTGIEATALVRRLRAGDYAATPSPEICPSCPYAEICEDRVML